jgi:hypothetical protein
MALVDLHLPPDPTLPRDVRAFLREARRRVARLQRERVAPAFVPSDFGAAYAALRALEASGVAPGRCFCEWGSGLGVVACLAALLGFDACGIEVEPDLVEAAGRLADDFGLSVQFTCGNFLPHGAASRAAAGGEFAWLAAGGPPGYDALGLDPDDFAVVYAYPWPDEERLTAAAFGRHARPGAVLATYHSGETVRLRRWSGNRRADRRGDASGGGTPRRT